MRLQVSSDLDSEIPQLSIIRKSDKISWRRFQRTGTTKGVQSFRKPPHGRSRAYVGFNSSKICRVASSRLYKGQKCYSYCKNVCWVQAQFYRPEFLSQRSLNDLKKSNNI